THDAGAWQTAQHTTGADLALTFATEVPSVALLQGEVEHLARYTTNDPHRLEQTTTSGITPERFASLAGVMPETQALLCTALPSNASEVSMQVYAESLANGEIATRFALDVVNALGVPRSLVFTTSDETVTGRFVSYSALLPDDPHLP